MSFLEICMEFHYDYPVIAVKDICAELLTNHDGVSNCALFAIYK